ncbi:MAG: amino acid ABC transporter substrate-binding protein [Bacillati bacterium ANGP1]|uniref:Amino acid ABC transporter substrate-binding protein n=1 Tax=Candidatus Segetimicrobium genomatis TaxID=2569760 RepID=A0A537JU69_9BACT|nr:MAG: amino acid ABC transporter substrate-binding protein [Terrabacteria group bacterium ANGP1]
MSMQGRTRGWLCALLAGFFLVATSLPVLAGVGGIGGISSFTGGDGSFKRVLREGIVIGIADDYPFTYQDSKTKEFDGLDVRIFRAITKLLGIEKVSWQIVQFDAMIPGLVAKRWDVAADNIHENPKRLAVIDFTSPAYWYGSALAVYKGNPKNIHTAGDLAGKVVGVVRGSFNHTFLENRKDIKELKLYTTNESEFADLIARRIDVTMEDDIKVGLFIKNHPGVPMEFATGYAPALEEYGYARYGIRKADIDLNHAISRAIDELRGKRDGIPKILEEGGLGLRNMWYWPVTK